MKTNKIVVGIICLLIAIASNLLVANHEENVAEQPVELHVVAKAENDTNIQVYYLQKNFKDDEFSANHMLNLAVTKEKGENDYSISVPADTVAVRIMPQNVNTDAVGVKSAYLQFKDIKISDLPVDDSAYNLEDKALTWNIDYNNTFDAVEEGRHLRNIIMKVLVCAVIDLLLLIIFIKFDKLIIIPREVMQSRKLIGSLAKNDFKQKFAGSYLGTIWAFVQPIITVLVYWFVFEKALNVGTQSTKVGLQVPFVLWLIAGLVPWFYFSEVLSFGTNTLIEYNYLVKKVVFKISALPTVKGISSLFVHVAFVVFAIILYACYGYIPNLYTLQVIYYSFCMFLLCIGLIYLTSAVMVFFRDLSQIINVLLQVGMWMTPIMWNMDAMANRIPGWAMVILKLNPMYYIVNGYRDALYNNMWFWERPGMTVYFWIFTVVMLIVGMSVFRKLQQHFADVL